MDCVEMCLKGEYCLVEEDSYVFLRLELPPFYYFGQVKQTEEFIYETE